MPSELPLRTHRNDAPASFHDEMAEQLRHAPWLFVSLLAHAFVLLMVWLLLPPEARREEIQHVNVDAPIDTPLLQPPPPPELPKVVPDEPIPVVDVTVTDPEPMADTPPADTADPNAPADPVDAGNPTLGLAPIGKFGPSGVPGRPSGRGPGRGSSSPRAVGPALDWLARHQDASGKWDCDGFMKHDTTGAPCDGGGNAVHDVGITGLALLAFLGDGNTPQQGPYSKQVRAAMLWLREQQAENGRFGADAAGDFVYDHAIAAYAMCEAFGLSKYQLLRDSAQRGIDYLQAHRNPYGAWRYQPRSGDSDTSVTGWCVLAMCSAEHFGLTVDRNALQMATSYLESCTSPDGHLGYQQPGQPSARKPGRHSTLFPPDRTEALTAVGLFCRFFLGQSPAEQTSMRGAAERLRRRLPSWDVEAGAIDYYYWYYGTYAMFQIGGPAWREWSLALAKAVVPRQRQGGNEHGSWDPIDAWGEDGGRVYSTAILALTLQANNRYGKLVPGNR